LDVRLSTASEYAFQTRQAAAITARASGRIWKAFQADIRPAQLERSQLPGDRRDIVVLCHGTSARLGEGQINLNDLPNGRLDVMARCVAAALFVSYGIRRSVRLWLLLREIGLTICVDGALVKGLYPDERRLAVAIQQTLRSGQGGQFEPPPGWALHGSMASREDEAIGNRLGAILGATYRRGAGATGATGARRGDGNAGGSEAISGDDRVLLVVLDEQGAPFVQLVTDAGNEHAGMLSAGQPKQPEQPEQQPVADSDRSEGVSGLRTGRFRTVLVVGDHVGFTQEEQDAMQHLGAIKARLGPVQLLASHCIVLAHAVLDAANVAWAARS
jgi:tRNA pseudouridine-54 N-methylase